MSRNNLKVKCDECNKEYSTRGLVWFKGKFLCFLCRTKLKGFGMLHKIPFNKTMEELLDKTYEVKCASKNQNYPVGLTNFNRRLVGKKFKMILVEE